MNNKAIIALAAVIALSAGMIVKNLETMPEKGKNDFLPKFSLPDLTEKNRHISEWKGKILIINFWATWCPPCLKEIPGFIALQDEFGDKGLQFIGIAIEEREPVDEYIDFININYPILIGEDAGIALSHQLGNRINAVPFSIVVDKKGNIIHRHPGEFSRKQIMELITPLL